MATEQELWDAYQWEPGHLVLRNLAGIRNQAALHTFEYAAVADRMAELLEDAGNLSHTFDAAHMCAIHRHLFQDVYDWAGEYRTTQFHKGRSVFATTTQIDHALEEMATIVEGTPWHQLDQHDFVDAISEVYAWCNYAHPFREGNGRVAKVFLADVAALSTHRLEFGRVSADDWNMAAALSTPIPGGTTPNPHPLLLVFDLLTAPEARPHRRADPPIASYRVVPDVYVNPEREMGYFGFEL